MGPKSRVIIDTDPGVDDILALLLALSSSPEEIEVPLISLTFGNIDVKNCLRNAVSMFHVIERELEWRRKNGQKEGFEGIKACKPMIAVGATEPLDSQPVLADYFHGSDGLGEVHATLPHLSPTTPWEALFAPLSEGGTLDSMNELEQAARSHGSFTSSKRLAHQEILRVLKESDPDTVTIVAVGPLTNLALAAAEDVETFLRVKEVVVMGGAVDTPGNVTPGAEFNTFADPVAAARVYALTSKRPLTTMPVITPVSSIQATVPETLANPLTLKLASLDITRRHNFRPSDFRARIGPLKAAGSPLAEWVSVIVEHSFNKIGSLHTTDGPGDEVAMSLHDPVCIWYALTSSSPHWTSTKDSPVDLRVETTGQWTRGLCVVDRRTRKIRDDDQEDINDHGNWRGREAGNRIDVLEGAPGDDAELGGLILDRVFGPKTL